MSKPNDGSPNALQAHFLAILPRIELHARVYFRGVRCPHKREDYVQETRALAWKYFVRATEQGKDPLTFVSHIATFAAIHAKSGRRLCGQQKARDVLSPVAQQRHNFTVQPLPTSTARSREHLYSIPHGQDLTDAVEERLRDNTHSPVPEQVAFSLDWPAWLTTRTERDRRIIEDMGLNHRTLDLARTFGVCPGRISQLRREYHDDWAQFTGDTARGESASSATV